MKVELEPISVIHTQIGVDPDGKVTRFFTETCYKAMDKYVPKDFGTLRTVVTVGKNFITYEMPYAEYQYKGIREDGTHKVTHYTTAGTGPYWDERMMTADGEKINSQVQRYVNRIL